MTMLTSEQDTFLQTNRWALIATVGRSGAPQVTMVAYHWDGQDIVVSTRRAAAKWVNTAHQPLIGITVTDDQRCLSVYGTAERIADDPEREALSRRVQASLLPDHAAQLERDFVKGLDVAGRVIIRLVPDRAIGRI